MTKQELFNLLNNEDEDVELLIASNEYSILQRLQVISSIGYYKYDELDAECVDSWQNRIHIKDEDWNNPENDWRKAIILWPTG